METEQKKSLWQRLMDWLEDDWEDDDEKIETPELPVYPEEFKEEDKRRKNAK